MIPLKPGTFLLDRNGNLTKTTLHVPSTKYMMLNIKHLSSTDGDYLYTHHFIDFDELVSIVLYCYIEYLETYEGTGSIIDQTKFIQYGELKYAPNAREALQEIGLADIKTLYDMKEDYPDFNSIDNKFYNYLCNNFVKVSVYGKSLEFRISSNDSFDWNKVIIDECLLKNYVYVKTLSISILKDFNGSCKSYFMNASIEDIIESDKIVLSSTKFNRQVKNGKIIYTAIE